MGLRLTGVCRHSRLGPCHLRTVEGPVLLADAPPVQYFRWRPFTRRATTHREPGPRGPCRHTRV